MRRSKKIAALPNVEIEGMFTHFARADETDKAPAVEQLKRYLAFAGLLEKAGVQIPLKHCSNSAGIIRMPEANLNLGPVRELRSMVFIRPMKWRGTL